MAAKDRKPDPDEDVSLGLSDEDREQLGNLLKKNRNNTNRMTAEDCAEVRRRYRDGETFEGMVGDMPVSTQSAVAYHARGDCDCRPDTPPVEGDPDKGGTRITDSECGEIRRLFAVRQDLAVRDLLEQIDTEFDGMSEGAIYYHAYGRCACDPDRDPAPKRTNRGVPTGEKLPRDRE